MTAPSSEPRVAEVVEFTVPSPQPSEMDITSSDEDDMPRLSCSSCYDEGVAYWSDDMYGACMDCDAAYKEGLIVAHEDGWVYTERGLAATQNK